MKVKRVFIAGFALALAANLFAAGQSQGAGGKPLIGISKLMPHPALDACEQGVQDRLKERGLDVSFDLQNAAGDMSTAAQIATKFKSEGAAVTVGIATPSAIALATASKDTPIVFTAVTDPVGAGLVASLSNGTGNVTGVSDAIPTADQVKLFQAICGIKSLGYIFTASEANSITDRDKVEAACKDLGIELVTQSITTSAEIRQAAQAIVNRVDGIYVSTDNTVVSGLPALIEVFNNGKKPIFVADTSNVRDGGVLIASGFNYYKLGLATGDIVADILAGKEPGDIPVKFMTEPSESDLLFDLDNAKALGITIPEEYLSQANMIFENGKLTEK